MTAFGDTSGSAPNCVYTPVYTMRVADREQSGSSLSSPPFVHITSVHKACGSAGGERSVMYTGDVYIMYSGAGRQTLRSTLRYLQMYIKIKFSGLKTKILGASPLYKAPFHSTEIVRIGK